MRRPEIDRYLTRLAFGSALLFFVLVSPQLVVKFSGLEGIYNLAERADFDYAGAVGETEVRTRKAMEANPEAWTIKTESRPREAAITIVEEALKITEETKWLASFYAVQRPGKTIGLYVGGLAFITLLVKIFRETPDDD